MHLRKKRQIMPENRNRVFKHQQVQLPVLEQLNLEEGRRYQVGDQRFPSITTVLGDTSDKTWLNAWKARVGEEEAQRRSNMATRRGTHVHTLCEDYLSNKELVEQTVDSMMMFRAMRPALDRMDNIRALETQLYSTALKVAGTVDCIAEMDGKLSIIDFKTANRRKSRSNIYDYYLQGCFYFTAYYERTRELPEQVVILITVADGSIQEFKLQGPELIHYTKLLQQRIDHWYMTYGIK